MLFRSNPNGPLTIGHARGVATNSEYARMYEGKVVLRFDDTDTRVKPPMPEAYGWIEAEYEWLAGRPADIIIRASERMPIYLDHVRALVIHSRHLAMRFSGCSFLSPHQLLRMERRLPIRFMISVSVWSETILAMRIGGKMRS